MFLAKCYDARLPCCGDRERWYTASVDMRRFVVIVSDIDDVDAQNDGHESARRYEMYWLSGPYTKLPHTIVARATGWQNPKEYNNLEAALKGASTLIEKNS